MQPECEFEMSHREASLIRELAASQVAGLIKFVGTLALYLPERDKAVISRQLVSLAAQLDGIRH